MKKITITIATAILIAGTVFANAETNTQGQNPRAMMRRGVATTQVVGSSTRPMPPQGGEGREGLRVEGMMPIVTTGDDATDAQIKALATEMEAKVKAIRDDYQTRIESIIKSKLPLQAAAQAMYAGKKIGTTLNQGTTTRSMMQRGVDENLPNGSSTDVNIPPMGRRFGEVRGLNTEGVGQAVGQDVGSRMMGFFRGMFGGR